MGIQTTGNHRIDTATAEIAVVLRGYAAWDSEQAAYDEAARLRDEIMEGTADQIRVEDGRLE